MNTGIQRSSATPYGAWTTTTPVKHFKNRPKKDIDAIMAAHRIPYQATANTSYPEDLFRKMKKAKEIKGTRFFHIYAPCPTGWKSRPEDTIKLGRMVVQNCIFPLFEVAVVIFDETDTQRFVLGGVVGQQAAQRRVAVEMVERVALFYVETHARGRLDLLAERVSRAPGSRRARISRGDAWGRRSAAPPTSTWACS